MRNNRNSDLQQHSFATMPEQATQQNSKKRFSVNKLRRRLKLNRKSKNETYETRNQRRIFSLFPAAVVLLVITFVLAGGVQQVGGIFSEISLFKVKSLNFTGCEATSEDRLRLLTGINLYQTSLLEIDKDEIAARVVQDPWVSSAKVQFNWPSRIVIKVEEFRPVAMINKSATSDPRLFYVDKSGKPFMEVGPGQDVDYPVITGLDRFTAEEERRTIFNDIRIFLKQAAKNNPNLPAQSVSEIHVNDNGELVVYLVDHTFPIFFGKGRVSDKYWRLVKVLDVLYREKKKGMLISGVEYIRMDYLNDKVLVAQSESG